MRAAFADASSYGGKTSRARHSSTLTQMRSITRGVTARRPNASSSAIGAAYPLGRSSHRRTAQIRGRSGAVFRGDAMLGRSGQPVRTGSHSSMRRSRRQSGRVAAARRAERAESNPRSRRRGRTCLHSHASRVTAAPARPLAGSSLAIDIAPSSATNITPAGASSRFRYARPEVRPRLCFMARSPPGPSSPRRSSAEAANRLRGRNPCRR